MSQDSDQAGAPVEQPVATDTQIMAAVVRSAPVQAVLVSDSEQLEQTDVEASAIGVSAQPISGVDDEAGVVVAGLTPTHNPQRASIVAADAVPSAGPAESAAEIFAANPVQTATVPKTSDLKALLDQEALVFQGNALSDESTTALPQQQSQGASNKAPSFEHAVAPVSPAVAPQEIRISADHPMAALYMQSPTPPELRGNRGPGVLIALLATLAFGVVLAGAFAAMLAPSYPPSSYFSDGLLPWLLSWPYLTAVGTFFVGLAILVLIAGRAGWWAYIFGGFFVGILVWLASLAALGLFGDASASAVDLMNGEPRTMLSVLVTLGLSFPAVVAGIIAREVTVWFGAWIGARGRKVTLHNAQALTEYEAARAEAQVQASV